MATKKVRISNYAEDVLHPETESSIVTYGNSNVETTLDDLTSNAVTSVTATGTSPLTLSASKSGNTATVTGSVDLSAYAKTSDLPTLSDLGGVGSVSASGTSPLTLSASKSGTAVTISGNVDLSDYAKTTDLPTLSGLGGVGSISTSATSPLSLSASKSGTTVTLSGSVDTYDKSTIDSMIASATEGGITNITASGTSPLTLNASVSGTSASISGSVDLSDYAKSADVPTKTSELTNDSGFITSSDIPATPTLSDLGGVGSVSASGTSPLSLSASKSGTSVSISGSVDLSSYAKTTDVEAVATQAQTNAEAINGISILPFAGFYSVNYTFTSGDIVWVRDGNYFARIDAVDSGTYQVHKLADGDYNSGGVARTDRLYRCYYSDLVANSDYAEESKMGIFTLYRVDESKDIVALIDRNRLDDSIKNAESYLEKQINTVQSNLEQQVDTLQEQLAETPNINIIPYPFPNGKKGNQVFDSDTQITTVAFDGLLQNYYGEIHSNGYNIGFNDTATITVSTTGYFTFSCMARAVEGYDQPATINFLMFAEGTINMIDGVTLSTTTWTRISATGTFSSGTIGDGSGWITVTSGARVQLGNFKLEAGSTATAWQPSLRDLGLF